MYILKSKVLTKLPLSDSAVLVQMTYYSELLLVGGSRLEGQERSVVSNLVFPLTVEIVTHDVDKVQVLAELWDVITANQI